MQQGQAEARQRIRETLDLQPDLTIILDATGSPSSRLRARFLSQSGEVLKIQLTTALGQGMLVSIAGDIDTGAGRQPVLGQFRVRTTKVAGAGKYEAELAPEPVSQDTSAKESPQATDDLDCYEVLQVSRNADMDTIHRVFHALAQRYHPDNRDTGNEEKFRQVVEAHTVLSDRERRAAYDVRMAEEDKSRFKIFDSLQSTQGVQAEVRKRLGILRLLYTRRLTDPHQPSMRARDFAEMLGCPLEHLEFSLWFLRESRLIYRSDNNKFEITHHGVETFEAQETTYAKKQVLPLPAPAA